MLRYLRYEGLWDLGPGRSLRGAQRYETNQHCKLQHRATLPVERTSVMQQRQQQGEWEDLGLSSTLYMQRLQRVTDYVNDLCI